MKLMRLCFTITFLYYLLAQTPTSANGFRVAGASIVGPEGKPFVPLGVNMNGSEWGWNAKTAPLADLVAKTWKLNTVRLNCRVPGVRPTKYPDYQDNNDEEAIIAAYTGRGVVVILEAHNWTGTYPTDEELPVLTAWHVERARKHKDNPYVWFNVMNEPGGKGEASPRWLEVHRAVIRAIRETGAGNIIVCDGASWGQDTGGWSEKPVGESASAILSFGPKLAKGAGGEFENIVFSFHTYDQWKYGDGKIRDYLERIHARKMAVFIGETGAPGDVDERRTAAETSYRVALPMGVGILAWHGQPGDGFALCKGKNGGVRGIDDPVNPTNLNWHGRLLWDAARAQSR